ASPPRAPDPESVRAPTRTYRAGEPVADPCGDRVAGSSPEDNGCELDDPGSRDRAHMDLARELHRRAQAEVSRHELLELGGGSSAVLASCCGVEPCLAHVVPAAPVARRRAESREAHVPPVRRHADAVDTGAACDGNPPTALGPGAKNGEGVVGDPRRGRPTTGVDRDGER